MRVIRREGRVVHVPDTSETDTRGRRVLLLVEEFPRLSVRKLRSVHRIMVGLCTIHELVVDNYITVSMSVKRKKRDF